MERKLKRAGIVLLALAMVLSAVSVGFAAEETYVSEEELLENILLSEDMTEDDYPLTRAVSIIYAGDFVKNSATKATAAITCRCGEQVRSLTSTITLQVYSSSSGSYGNTSVAPAVQTVKDARSISQKAVFKIVEGKKYRIKIVIKAITDKGTTTETFYRNML